jgi:protein-tyrosine phosphatase
MHRNHSSSKRSRSPAVLSQGSGSQMDGACFSRPGQAEADPQDSPPKMPSFLTLGQDGKLRSTPVACHLLKLELEMREKYDELVRMENERLASSKNGPGDCQWARLDPDPVLDRYTNIHPWANNRIKLHVPDGINDYINASPVTLTSTSAKQNDLKSDIPVKYICMQGPKSQTVDHVWHMIWHEIATPYNSSPAIILMLSPTHAQSHDDPSKSFEKCYPYYPLDENSPPIVINSSDQLGKGFKAILRFASREPSIPGTAIEVRKFIMSVDGEEDEKPIWHYLYPNWPDFGALDSENVDSILALMELSRKQNGKGDNPRVVHCSAGVGRTGTFVALEFLSGELQGGAWEGWDLSGPADRDPIYETVNQLRMQRKTMVQSFEQYVFLYEVLRKMWEVKNHPPCVGGEHKHLAPPDVNGGSERPAKVIKK